MYGSCFAGDSALSSWEEVLEQVLAELEDEQATWGQIEVISERAKKIIEQAKDTHIGLEDWPEDMLHGLQKILIERAKWLRKEAERTVALLGRADVPWNKIKQAKKKALRLVMFASLIDELLTVREHSTKRKNVETLKDTVKEDEDIKETKNDTKHTEEVSDPYNYSIFEEK